PLVEIPSGAGPSDGETVDAEGGQADAYGNLLAILSARADAFVEPQIAADSRHSLESIGAVADQGGSFHWPRHASALDEICFGGREDEFAAGDGHVFAAEGRGAE